MVQNWLKTKREVFSFWVGLIWCALKLLFHPLVILLKCWNLPTGEREWRFVHQQKRWQVFKLSGDFGPSIIITAEKTSRKCKLGFWSYFSRIFKNDFLIKKSILLIPFRSWKSCQSSWPLKETIIRNTLMSDLLPVHNGGTKRISRDRFKVFQNYGS